MEAALERVERLAHKSVDSLGSKIKQYDEWSPNFEEDVALLDYSAPTVSVELFNEVVKETNRPITKESRVIDFATGTGLVGTCLRKSGFSGQIDAQDGSSNMLEVAEKKSIYTNFYHCFIEQDSRLSVPSVDYDCGFLCGALSDSQVQPACLKLLLYHIKVGGLLIFTTRSNKSNLVYKESLEKEIARLTEKELWEKIVIKNVEEFERATSTDEVSNSADKGFDSNQFPYIPGTIYCYSKLKMFEI